MKLQFALALMLAVLSQNANAQAPGGPIGIPSMPVDTTAPMPVLPQGPKEELPNPDQPPVLVCVAPVTTQQSTQRIRVLVADREAKTVAITLQSKGSVDYYDRVNKVIEFNKAGECLEYQLRKTFKNGDIEEATLEVDLTRQLAMVTSGKGVPVIFPTCKTFEKGDYLKVAKFLRGQL